MMMSLICGKATNYDSVLFLACNDITDTLEGLNSLGIEARAIDYDPKFEEKDFYTCKDFIFDEVDLTADLVIHMNCEKTYMFERKGDVILIGDDKHHNGDCKPVLSCEQLVHQYGIEEVYEQGHWSERATFLNGISHYWVYGRI